MAKRFRDNAPEQIKVWESSIDLLKGEITEIIKSYPAASSWGVLFEYQLLRLQKRLDVVLLAGDVVVVIEFKGGAEDQTGVWQVEDYALDLRDFHSASQNNAIVPILCSTVAESAPVNLPALMPGVLPVQRVGKVGLSKVLFKIADQQEIRHPDQIDLLAWDEAPYRPVPTIIEAAELLYAGHHVREIADASADRRNLADTTDRLIAIISEAQLHNKRVICFVTGVPGSGKTLTGLNAVHDARFRSQGRPSGAFLSGNTPLVEVLREALARDDARRTGTSLKEALRKTKAEIQLLMRFLEEYLDRQPHDAPHEQVVVFDEAQRAWDADYGKRKFNRQASEPFLFLEIMSRHKDWAGIIALVGGGQEINTGEGGLSEWGAALAAFNGNKPPDERWLVYATGEVLEGGQATAGQKLFRSAADPNTVVNIEPKLHLSVSVRSYRCETAVEWVNAILNGDCNNAMKIASQVSALPIHVTRSLNKCRDYLTRESRGHRRCGLVGSSGAGRLRAYGLGSSLSAQELGAVRHWYLKPRGDIRSSYALEVFANEYTCQGLELDHVGLAWGGDLLWDHHQSAWTIRALSGTRWVDVKKPSDRQYIINTYRVLLTRARAETVIWVPPGNSDDLTCDPNPLDETYEFLCSCGLKPLA